MAFEILNEAASVLYVLAGVNRYPQAEPDKVDFDILAQGVDGEGIVSGCAVTPQGAPDTTVAVAAGVVRIGGTDVAYAGGNVNCGAAHAGFPRFDLIAINNAGAASAVAGVAAEPPVFPAVPANSVIVAAVWRAANDNTITAADIVDKRVGVGGNTLDAAYDQGGAGAGRIVTVDSGAIELRHVANLTMLATRDPGDANDRFALSRDGDMSWGSGAAVADIVLSRAAANRLAFAAGDILSVQYVADIAGTTRLTTAAASPHVKVTGDLHVFGNTGERIRVGPLAPAGDNIIEATTKTPTYGGPAEVNFFKASHIGGGVLVGTWSVVRGFFGLPIVAFAAGSVNGQVYGLQFNPKVVGGTGGSTIIELDAIRATYEVGAYSGTIALARGAEIEAPAFSGVGWTITLSTGVHIGNFGNSALIADAYGLKIEDMTANTGFQRLIEAGPATPYLRLVGGGDAAAFQTNLYLKEAANLRQVQWMDPGAGGGNFAGGERVMILV